MPSTNATEFDIQRRGRDGGSRLGRLIRGLVRLVPINTTRQAYEGLADGYDELARRSADDGRTMAAFYYTGQARALREMMRRLDNDHATLARHSRHVAPASLAVQMTQTASRFRADRGAAAAGVAQHADTSAASRFDRAATDRTRLPHAGGSDRSPAVGSRRHRVGRTAEARNVAGVSHAVATGGDRAPSMP